MNYGEGDYGGGYYGIGGIFRRIIKRIVQWVGL